MGRPCGLGSGRLHAEQCVLAEVQMAPGISMEYIEVTVMIHHFYISNHPHLLNTTPSAAFIFIYLVFVRLRFLGFEGTVGSRRQSGQYHFPFGVSLIPTHPK